MIKDFFETEITKKKLITTKTDHIKMEFKEDFTLAQQDAFNKLTLNGFPLIEILGLVVKLTATLWLY